MNSNELVDKMETLAIKRGMQARIDELGHALAKAKAERDEWQSAHSIRSDELDGAIGMLNEARARVAELEADKARLDWLEAHSCAFPTDKVQTIKFETPRQNTDDYEKPTVRAAIDAAKGTNVQPKQPPTQGT